MVLWIFQVRGVYGGLWAPLFSGCGCAERNPGLGVICKHLKMLYFM